MSQAEELIQVVGSVVTLEDGREFREVTVDGEPEGSANGRHAPDDVSAINGGGIPGIDGNVGCFRGDLGISGSLINGNLECLVEEAEEAFHRDRLMVAFEGRVVGEVEGIAHAFEVLFEG